MLSARGRKKQRESAEATQATTRDASPTADPLLPVQDQTDAFRELLGEFAAVSRSRLRSVWRRLRWALVALPLLGIAAPGYLWLQHHSQHVTSKNAAARGHLAEIGTRLSGLVSAVAVDDGDRVKAGQVLVQLEDRHLVAQVHEARAEVAGLEQSIEVEKIAVDMQRREIEQRKLEARAEVAGLENTIEVERLAIELQRREIEQRRLAAAGKVAAASAATETARIEAEDASRNFELQKSLSSGGGVSSSRVSDAEYAWRTAEAKLQEARANALVESQTGEQAVRLAEDTLTIRERKISVLETDLAGAQARLARAEADVLTIRDRQIAVLEARLLAAQARLTRAETDVASAAIRAPQDGAIVRRIIQPGGSINVGQPIISMWLGDEIWVEAWVEEEDLGYVRRGGRATVTFHAFPGREFAGTVDTIGLATDLEIPDTEVPQPRSTRMRGAPVVGVRIRLLEPSEFLLPGLSAIVAIEKTDPNQKTGADENEGALPKTGAAEKKD